MIENKKIMIISPHADDETLGCGGILSSNVYSDCMVLLVTKPRMNEQKEEFVSVIDELRVKSEILNFKDISIGIKDIPEISKKIKEYIKSFNPDLIFMPTTSIHQDHEIVNRSTLIACKDFNISVLEYEYPELHCNFLNFDANYFFKMNEGLFQKKKNLFSKYISQTKRSRDLRALRILAEFRGMQCSEHYAEAFKIIKIYG